MSWIQSDLQWTEKPYVPPSWSTGTDAEIIEALEKHYNDEIDLTEYWSVGDERVVSLPQIADGGYVNETQPAQNVTLVILNVGGKELVEPINGHTECAFIVGLKDCMYSAGVIYILSDNAGAGWYNSNRRLWCNYQFYTAFPSTIQSIFKLHNNYVGEVYNATSPSKSEDRFCLPSVKEITGSNSPAYNGTETKNNLLEYYETSSNRVKNLKGSAYNYWTSSKYYTTTSTLSYRRRMCYINNNASGASSVSTNEYGIAPQGVI